ncbi:MAG: glycosyl hydrolase 2 galactose-binding domain-containing protein [Clostridia bacterium]
MREISLCGAWSLRGRQDGTGEEFQITATVPGCVHTDLIQNGIVKDIFKRGNAREAQWIERGDWIYCRDFTCEDAEPGAQLIFEGLDTYCDIYLNGTWIGRGEDMFIKYVFDVAGILTEGKNTLEVYFYSPVRMVRGRKKRPAAFTAERLSTRRIQCTYGWDWVDRFVTCGIYRPVFLRFGTQQITDEDLYIYTVSANPEWAQIAAELHFNGTCTACAEVFDPSGRRIYENSFYCAENFRKEQITIRNPQLWYPNGMGGQPLYLFQIRIADTVVASCRFGIRTAEVVQLADLSGGAYSEKCRVLQNTKSGREYDFNQTYSGFTLYINGRPVWCRGGNWVPCEPFPSAETEEKITGLLEAAAAAHVNMIRVWGGGIFEKSHFYEECDRLGILVTQDFLMACGAYPEDEPWFLRQLSFEAESAAKRLRNHPCLIWWSGDNENAIRGNDLDPAYPGRRSALQAIAPVLQKLDPHRLFFPSSPYGGDRYASKTRGTTHNTQFLEYLLHFIEQGEIEAYKEYFKEYVARFIAEEPTMGASSFCSLKKFMTEDDIFGENLEMWKYHTKTNPFLPRELFDYTGIFAERLLGPFRDGEDRLFKLQYIQYEWMRLTMELYRRNQGFCSGVVYWMLDDCWPAASGWALIDYYGVPKAAYYAFQKAAGHVLASFDRGADGALELYAANDTAEAVPATLILTRIGENGAAEKTISYQAEIPANASACVLRVPEELAPGREKLLVCDLRSNAGFYRAFYREGGLPLEECADGIRIRQEAGSVTIRASSYVHTVALDAAAIFEDNFFSLLPGETRTIRIHPFRESWDGIYIKTYTIKESRQ